MKTILLVTLLSLLMAGCADSKKSKKAKQPTAEPAVKKIELIPINYPTAIVYEGGLGEPGEHGSKPLWRLFICLSGTSTPITGQVKVDLAQLGQPAAVQKVTYTTADGGKEVTNFSFTDFTINYRYTSFLMSYPEMPHGYGWGEAAVQISGFYNYQPATKGFGVTFSQSITRGSFASYESRSFHTEDPKQLTYIKNWLVRFTASSKENRINPITPCEKENKPYFFQVGDQIVD